ncbi:MAG: hypothetical protein EOP53_26325 [Sphingobacteriales bacterium]|nr:MAG: hypothetical protein EOP53_26325 [Sphingobacteriales bacterium]
MLLGVSRSLWSLYELGLRDLPQPALELLAKILDQQKTESARKPAGRQSGNERDKIHLEFLKAQLNENKYQQLKEAKRLATAIRNEENRQKRKLLSRYIDTIAKAGEQNDRFASIKFKAIRAVEHQDDALVFEIRFRQEKLLLEKKLIEKKIENIMAALENTKIFKTM